MHLVLNAHQMNHKRQTAQGIRLCQEDKQNTIQNEHKNQRGKTKNNERKNRIYMK